MSPRLHPIVSEELEALEGILRQLAEVAPPEERAEQPLVQELERLRDMLVSREDTKDIAALSDQWHRQSSILSQLRRGRPQRRVDPDSPYFAHLRLFEGDEQRELYLGRATCLEKGLRIVDWRDAPISKIFYRYAQGEDYEEDIAGRLRSGRVIARRMLAIRGARLERIQAPEGDFVRRPNGAGDAAATWECRAAVAPRLVRGQEVGVRVHGRGPDARARLHGAEAGAAPELDKRLAEITGLIDPEQFELITRPEGLLVIRGVAGSGKTTVALHRVAYLAFDQPQVDSDATLVLVFSEALRRYVSHVLPSLGLEHVRVRTYRDWALAERQRHFRELPTGHRDDTPSVVQRLKLSPDLEVALREHIRATPGAKTARRALEDWAEVLTRRPLLADALRRRDPAAVSDAQIDELIDWCTRRVHEVYAHLEGELDPAERLRLDPEDDALLLRAFQLRVGRLRGRARRPLRLAHVVLDEVQDFSPTEVQVLLGCLDERASITLAGDTQQHIALEGGVASWADLCGHLGIDGAEIETLQVSYRSTEPILRLALDVLGPLREDEEPPRTLRSGPPVEIFEFTDTGACIAFLTDALRELEEREPLASVAILAPTSTAADLYHQGLARAELRRLRRIRAGEFPFVPGIEVTEIEQAKGLEFDHVILVDISAKHFPDRPAERRRLHVGATRAVHQLWITAVGRPSPLLPSEKAGLPG